MGNRKETPGYVQGFLGVGPPETPTAAATRVAAAAAAAAGARRIGRGPGPCVLAVEPLSVKAPPIAPVLELDVDVVPGAALVVSTPVKSVVAVPPPRVRAPATPPDVLPLPPVELPVVVNVPLLPPPACECPQLATVGAALAVAAKKRTADSAVSPVSVFFIVCSVSQFGYRYGLTFRFQDSSV